jgi:hypothetical protein
MKVYAAQKLLEQYERSVPNFREMLSLAQVPRKEISRMVGKEPKKVSQDVQEIKKFFKKKGIEVNETSSASVGRPTFISVPNPLETIKFVSERLKDILDRMPLENARTIELVEHVFDYFKEQLQEIKQRKDDTSKNI